MVPLILSGGTAFIMFMVYWAVRKHGDLKVKEMIRVQNAVAEATRDRYDEMIERWARERKQNEKVNEVLIATEKTATKETEKHIVGMGTRKLDIGR